MKRHPNYVKQMDRPGKDEHPIDLAVRKRIQPEADEERILRLHDQVRAQLGKKTKAFMSLEDARGALSDKREEAFFNVGYEHGLSEGAARARRAAFSKQGRQLARELRERIAQAQLSPDEAARVAHDVLGAVLLSGSEPRRPERPR